MNKYSWTPTISTFKICALLLALLALLVYYLCFYVSGVLPEDLQQEGVNLLCWVGILELWFILSSWRKLTGRWVSLYGVFIVFYFLFNFGQCLGWAFGIHSDGELGTRPLYYRLGFPTSIDLLRTQLIVLLGGFLIHVGALLTRSRRQAVAPAPDLPVSNQAQYLYQFCKILLPLAVICRFYMLLVDSKNAHTYGYTALYYDASVQHVNVIVAILARQFFPAIIGLLIGCQFKKHIRLAYVLIIINVLLGLSVGDRGGWIYFTLIFLVLLHYYYKPFNFWKIMMGLVAGYGMMSVLVAVRMIRDQGVTFAKLIEAFTEASINPLGDSLREIGGTMGITTVLVMEGYDIFPYGNTFLYGLLTAPSTDLISILNLNYQKLSGWFSQTYLGISNGAAFSIIGEMVLNFGPYFFPPFMLLFGLFIGFITKIEPRDLRTEPLAIALCTITTGVMINISRNAFQSNMGEIFYTTLLFWVGYKCYSLVRPLSNRKREK